MQLMKGGQDFFCLVESFFHSSLRMMIISARIFRERVGYFFLKNKGKKKIPLSSDLTHHTCTQSQEFAIGIFSFFFFFFFFLFTNTEYLPYLTLLYLGCLVLMSTQVHYP